MLWYTLVKGSLINRINVLFLKVKGRDFPFILQLIVSNRQFHKKSVILLHEKSGRTLCPKSRKTFRTFSKNLGQNSCQSNFHSTGC